MKDKIGLGVVTYNRPDYLKRCMNELEKNNWGGAQCVCVSDDASDDSAQRDVLRSLGSNGINIIVADSNSGVAHSKNQAIKYLLEQECEHIFLIEDDILVKSPLVCAEYVSEAQISGLSHLNFAHHGKANKNGGSVKTLENGYKVKVYPNSVGAFSYYSKECLEKVGLMDENFVNAWEHVEHTYRIANAGLTTPFWEFADHPNSKELLQEIEGSIDGSSIRPRKDWNQNIINGMNYWKKKHGSFILPRK